ncbi:MAG: PH domain-containing protein [Phycisphaerales bacterium]|nr:PH domain-containing protein [Phycisphaerales bacterium]
MNTRFEQSARTLYTGLFSFLVRWFRVPAEPPTLPVARPTDFHLSFQPSEGFLRYLKFYFWLVLFLTDICFFLVWLATLFVAWWLFLLLAPIALAIIVLPDIVAYIAIHLRYDTTWYVMTDRSLRIRRGIWTIHEVTITFENVQNVSLRQGPLQRHYRISTLMVQTAGGGGSARGPHGEKLSSGHEGIIEGIANAPELRDRILTRLRQSPTAGLGDEALNAADASPDSRVATRPWAPHPQAWSPAHLDALRAIRDELKLRTLSS